MSVIPQPGSEIIRMVLRPSVETVNYLALIGRLDPSGVYIIENEFLAHLEQHKKNTIVDISGVTSLPSVGMRMLLNGARVLRSAGKKMILLRPRAFIEESLLIACLDQVFFITQDEHAAFKAALEK